MLDIDVPDMRPYPLLLDQLLHLEAFDLTVLDVGPPGVRELGIEGSYTVEASFAGACGTGGR